MVAFRQSDTRITTCQPFTVELLVMLVKQYEINVFQAAPYQLTLLLQHPLLITSDFDQILMFFVLGGLVPESLRKDFRKAFPEHPLIIAYGMSEACICISSTGPTEAIEGLTVGRIFNNVQVKIIGKNNHVVDIGVTGEILAKPEFPFLVREILKIYEKISQIYIFRDIIITLKRQRMQLIQTDSSKQVKIDNKQKLQYSN